MTVIFAKLIIDGGNIDMIGEVSGVAGSGTDAEVEVATKIIDGFQKVLLQFKTPDGKAYLTVKDFPSTERSNRTGS